MGQFSHISMHYFCSLVYYVTHSFVRLCFWWKWQIDWAQKVCLQNTWSIHSAKRLYYFPLDVKYIYICWKLKGSMVYSTCKEVLLFITFGLCYYSIDEPNKWLLYEIMFFDTRLFTFGDIQIVYFYVYILNMRQFSCFWLCLNKSLEAKWTIIATVANVNWDSHKLPKVLEYSLNCWKVNYNARVIFQISHAVSVKITGKLIAYIKGKWHPFCFKSVWIKICSCPW